MARLFAKFRTIITNQADEGGAIGGFALLFLLLYIIVAVLWPTLMVFGRNSEGLFLSVLGAPPAFLGVNILGIAGLFSSSARNRLLSSLSLAAAWVITLGIGALIAWAARAS